MPLLNQPAVTVHAPPSTDGLPAKVITLLAEYERLRAERHQAAAKLDALERSRPDVEQRDAAASAKALRSGKPLTEQRHLQAHIAEVAATRHLLLSLTTALDNSARDLTEAITNEKPGILTRAERDVARAEAAFGKAVAALEAAHVDVVASRAQRNWAERFPERSKGASLTGIDVLALSGEPLSVDTVLTKLKAVVPHDHAAAA